LLSAKVVRMGISVTEGHQMPHEVMALIGFSGIMRGTVASRLISLRHRVLQRNSTLRKLCNFRKGSGI
jgi:hypothetical protein